MPSIEQFVALSGLPRTGSTLLSSILSQNPNIHAEGSSAVCQLMWDMQQSVVNSEQMKASKKNLINELVKPIPHIYYNDVRKPIVVDKCRSWTLPANMEILHRYFDNKPKVIVLVRPLVQIVASFMSLRKANGWTDLEAGLLESGSEPIMRSLAGVEWARKNNNGEFLFITYDQLVDDTQATLKRIYEHCGWETFKHDLNNIKNLYPDSSDVNFLVGLHDVRPQVSRRTVNVELSNDLLDRCNRLDDWSMYENTNIGSLFN